MADGKRLPCKELPPHGKPWGFRPRNKENFIMTKETLEKILEKNKRIYNKRNHIDGIRCVTIEEEDSEMFEDLVNICINSGYKIISSSCNSSNWKAILVEDEKERS